MASSLRQDIANQSICDRKFLHYIVESSPTPNLNLDKMTLLHRFRLLRHVPLQSNAHERFIHGTENRQQSSTSNITTKKNSSCAKPYEEIPTKTSYLPASIELLLSGGPGYLHTHCDKRHKELGPIYKDYLGNIEIVFLGDTNFIQTVVANEGQYPQHNVPEAWSYYNEVHNVERGLFFQSAEPWARLRRVFNKVMLADPKNNLKFADDLFLINDHLLDSWMTKFSTNSPDTFLVPDIKAALCNWSIESTGSMLFGCRMGCVPLESQAEADPRANELVEYVAQMFAETSNFQLIPVRLAHKLKLSTWKRFEKATTGMLQVANLYASENLERVRKQPDSRSMLADMMKLESLSRDEISRSLVDLIIAAADTTSAALQWMIYLLAKHQDYQSRLLTEITEASDQPTFEKFKEHTPLLRAFLRESLRLYPTAPFLARTLDHEIVLGGYKIPAGKLLVFSLYSTSRMEKYFDDALKFKPERWLRPQSTDRPQSMQCPNRSLRHAYASLPFGIGARMCVGRRAAELQMLTFLASLVRRFSSSLNGEDKTKVRLKMILAPTKPISIKLKLR